ncbi:MAG: aminotransferase class IV, partial [Azovibrio sp.]
LLAALFPCGSITGAPKRRTMEIINQIEPAPRGLYTGAIGWLEPGTESDTESITTPDQIGPFCLSVAIRTLIAAPRDQDGTHPCHIGIGSGITYDSKPEDEYAECQWKARFLTQHDPGFALIETLRIENGTCPLLAAHLQRLTHSARQLGFTLDPNHITQEIQANLPPETPGTVGRLRLLLHKTGKTEIQFAPLPALAPQPVKLILAPQTLPDKDPLRRHKTTYRPHYDQGWQQAEQQGAFDSLFFNQQDQLLEGGRSSIFVKINGTWLTPPLSLDILPGVIRTYILQHQQAILDAPASEAIITRTQLQQAEEILAVNALRGIMPARIVLSQD